MHYFRVSFDHPRGGGYLTVRASSMEAVRAFYSKVFDTFSVRRASGAEIRASKSRGANILTLE